VGVLARVEALPFCGKPGSRDLGPRSRVMPPICLARGALGQARPPRNQDGQLKAGPRDVPTVPVAPLPGRLCVTLTPRRTGESE
jgi:hypothetical protein